MKGHFITFEGPDGAGKTTIINEIFKQIPQDKQTKILSRVNQVVLKFQKRSDK